MRPQKIGRALGIGVRLAGRVVEQQLTASAQPAPAAQVPQASTAPGQSNLAPRQGRQAAVQSGSIARGVGGFLRPFRRIGGILWLEVTGAFFLLPVAAFAPNLWRMRASWNHGPDHRMFLVTAGVVVLFLYLGVSSFWRARRR
jgi:hypothetical protein